MRNRLLLSGMAEGRCFREAYRASNGKGTVLVCNILGKLVKLEVFDARYRTAARWDGGSPQDTSLANYDGIPTASFNGTSDVDTAHALGITDARLNALFGGSGCHDTNTARQNTDILVTTLTFDDMAVQRCRAVGADLPNIQELAFIYCAAEQLDLLDPTIGSYPDNRLSGWAMCGAYAAWSSTEYGGSVAWAVARGGHCSRNDAKWGKLAVIPMLELA